MLMIFVYGVLFERWHSTISSYISNLNLISVCIVQCVSHNMIYYKQVTASVNFYSFFVLVIVLVFWQKYPLNIVSILSCHIH